MSEGSHSADDHNSENGNKPFTNKFIFPVLLLAILFYVFTLMTSDKSNGHGDAHGGGQDIEAIDEHMEGEGEHHDHEHEHDHGHEHHEHEH